MAKKVYTTEELLNIAKKEVVKREKMQSRENGRRELFTWILKNHPEVVMEGAGVLEMDITITEKGTINW